MTRWWFNLWHWYLHFLHRKSYKYYWGRTKSMGKVYYSNVEDPYNFKRQQEGK